VSALAADIRRHLASEPVSAGAPSVGQRVRKFARRNRTLVVTLAAVFVTLLIGVIATSVALVRAIGSEREEQWRLYVASIAAASDALESAEPDAARWHLEKAPQRHRQWEWRHLRAASDVSHWTVELGSGPWSLAVAGDDEIAVACRDDIRFLDASDGGVVRRFGELRSERIAVSSDGRFLSYLLGSEGRIDVFDVELGAAVATAPWALDHRREQVFDPERPLVAFGCPDGMVKWIDLGGGGSVRETRVASAGTLPMVAMLRGSDRIVVADGVSARPTIMNRDGSERAVFGGGAVSTSAVVVRSDPVSSLVATNHATIGQGEINIWDAETRRHVAQIKGHTGAVRSISLHSGLLVTGSDDRTIKIWNARTGAEIGTCIGHTDAVVATAFSPDGSMIYSIGLDETARAWRIVDLRRRVVHASFPILDTALARIADAAEVIAATGSRGQLGVWDLGTASLVFEAEIPGPASNVFVESWPTEPLLIFSGDRGDVRVLSYLDREWSSLREPAGSASRHGFRAGVDAAGAWLACPRPGGVVDLYAFDGARPGGRGSDSASPFRHIHTIEVGSEAHAVGVNSAGGFIIVGEADGGLSAFHFDGSGHRLLWRRRGNEGPIRDVAVSPDGRLIATGDGGLRGGVALWSVGVDGDVLWRQRRHYGRIDDLCFSPDSRRLVSASLDDSVRIWAVEQGEHLLALRGDHPERVCSAHFTSDGSTLVSASFDGRIVIRAVPSRSVPADY
jgi:WD40 repeat protein